jgi:two-component system response regulator GlrR
LLHPFRRFELLTRLMRQARVTRRSEMHIRKLKEDLGLKQIIGESPLFLAQVKRVPRFAECNATVLISGDSGTGKEVFARAIHYLSSRTDRPFVPVNCGAIPEHLVESEIFRPPARRVHWRLVGSCGAHRRSRGRHAVSR